MRKLQVYVELSGKQVHVGNIHGNGPDDACFEYDKKYIETQGAMPISLSLPFLNQEYDSEKTKYFFEGLLPEGFTRRCVAEWMHVEEWVFLHSVNMSIIKKVTQTSHIDFSYAP